VNTFEILNCKTGTHVNLYGDDGIVLGHHTERETGIDWVDLEWTEDHSKSSLPVDDASDLEFARALVHFEPTEHSDADPPWYPNVASATNKKFLQQLMQSESAVKEFR